MLFLALLCPFAASAMIHTPGKFSVTESGAATYAIPIIVTPGTAGMAPSLSFSYNSHAGNGILGVGWSLSGLSQILRCPQTIAQDGVNAGVNYDYNDRFCLDGERLSNVSGAYGGDGTEYRTELESFTKIVSHGVAGNGPAYFKVWTKSGQIIEYGNTADSRIEAQGKTTARLWAVSKISDTKGNYLTATYTEDNANGDAYVTRIGYTGNASASLSPYNSVQFTYQTRTDNDPQYIGGSVIRTMNRIANVKTYTGTTLVKDYRLGYSNAGAHGFTNLTSIQECDGANSCYPATTFTWQTGVGDYGLGASANLAPNGFLALGDVNGDGRADLIYPSCTPTSPCSLYLQLSTGSGFASGVYVGTIVTSWYCSSPGIGGSCNGYSPSYGAQFLEDVNGDGLADLIAGNSVRLSTGSGFGGSSNWGANSGFLTLGDVNGDGRADLIHPSCTFPNPCNLYLQVSTGVGFAAGVYVGTMATSWYCSSPGIGGSCNGYSPSYGAQFLEDVNGDGLADLIAGNSVRLSNGSGFGASSNWGGNGGFIVSGDVNGDGRADLLYPSCTPTSPCNLYLQLSTGSGFASGVYVGTTPTAWYCSSPGIGGSCNGYAPSLGKHLLQDVNGDGKADLGVGSTVRFANCPTSDLITKITNGLGAATSITHKWLSDTTVYAYESGSAFPIRDMVPAVPFPVVSETNSSNGIGGQFRQTYFYRGGKMDLHGRGFLGFRQVEATDTQTGIKTTATYRQDYPYIGLASRLDKTTSSGTLLNRVDTTYSTQALGGTRHFPFASQVAESSHELNGTLVFSTTTTNTFDAFGNPTQISVSTNDGFTKLTTNTYTDDSINWILGRLTRASVKSTIPGGANATRTSSFAYDAAGLLTSEVIEPDIGALKLTTVYVYDAFGNKKSATVSGSGIVTRTSSTAFDSQGRFPTSSTNAVGHTETRAYDARFGTVTSLTGPNALTTTWSYDGFGRKTLENRSDGTQTTWTYATCVSPGCTGAAYFIQTASTGAPDKTDYFDILDRPIRPYVEGFDGTWIGTGAKDYDALGRVSRAYRNFFSSATTLPSATFEYDILGRVVKETAPDGGITTYAYSAASGEAITVMVNAKGQKTRQVKNSQGQLKYVINAEGSAVPSAIYYSYDPFGNLTRTQDSAGNITAITYDLRGRKTSMSDPDMGTWSYSYNVLGELISQTDAKAQVVTTSYDKLGRMVSRNQPEYNCTWTYDTATKGKGKLASTSCTNGYSRTHTYDSQGRPSVETATIGGVTYPVTLTYDSSGRLATKKYPTGFTVKNIYNATGYLSEVRNFGANTLYWQANALNADLQVTSDTLGNGLLTARSFDALTGRIAAIQAGTAGAIQNNSYEFDVLGNLTRRTDAITSLDESFAYDALNRLTGVLGPSNKTYQYDALGNLTFKTDVGTYTYPSAGLPRPHAVSSTSGAVNTTYAYDANGNLTSGGGRTVTCTSFNMPDKISKGTQNASFTYDGERNRITQVAGNTTTTYLFAAHYEKESSGTLITHKHYLYAGNEMVGIWTTRSNNVIDIRYFHKDHLGSISVISDGHASLVQRLSYDAHGKRRNANGADATTAITSTFDRGFTGHEMLDNVGLVHMNGRIYDPQLGRFMSADPQIELPEFSQSYNRYSYVLNNPLSLTDPSGYGFLKRIFKKVGKFFKRLLSNKVVRIVVAAIAAYLTYGAVVDAGILGATAEVSANAAVNGAIVGTTTTATVASTATYVVAGAAGGFAGGFVASGGDFGFAVKSALGGAVFGGIQGHFGNAWSFERGAANSLAGGINSELTGGKFGDGFKLNALTSTARLGWEAARDYTDRSSLSGDGLHKYNKWRELLTDGQRETTFASGYSQADNNWITRLGMAREGSGDHWYNENSFIGRFVNWTSKAHDFMNSWGYEGGNYVSRSEFYNTVFQIYNGAGFLPAGAYTATAFSAGPATAYIEVARRDADRR